MATAFVALDGVLRTEVGDPIAEGVKLFRGIFDKNTHEQVKKFFSHPLIINLWPGIL